MKEDIVGKIQEDLKEVRKKAMTNERKESNR